MPNTFTSLLFLSLSIIADNEEALIYFSSTFFSNGSNLTQRSKSNKIFCQNSNLILNENKFHSHYSYK
ncbi:hypothetical protein BpHYR1_030323 [Brachionus plicatilis]|uniref:Uncharacterized protein n=1 Tax=Brachionus plicatilis TaxID=10195 RepID=A0A3M7RRY6_BRAPC|nr:hypothetical protein BpHYR1_030323 [Brachionus plicatilis]